MLPTADRLLEGLPFFVRRRGLDARFDRAPLVGALDEAEALAGGDPRAEPAALFYACARRPRAFGKAAQLVIPFLAQSQALAVGLELTIDPEAVELILMRLRVVRGEIAFAELQHWFAERLRPAP